MTRLAYPAAAILLAVAAWLWSALLSWHDLLTAWLALVAAGSFVLAVTATAFALEGWRTNAATPWPLKLKLQRVGQVLLACAYAGTVIWLAWRALGG